MTWIKRALDLGKSFSFNFVAPAGATEVENEVLFPFHEKQEPAYAATLAVAVKQMNTFLQPAALTGAVTINLTVDSQVTPGAMLHLKAGAAAERVITLGTGFHDDAANITVAAGTVVCKSFVFDGTSFIPVNQ